MNEILENLYQQHKDDGMVELYEHLRTHTDFGNEQLFDFVLDKQAQKTEPFYCGEL